MRIHRISLTDFEGVTSSEVVLAPTGMTIVEGPNEVGKSSLIRALDLLLQLPHDSKHARVLAACPVHVDAGPAVEVELRTGPYVVVYAKRWHKRPETTLTVLAPRPESLTGRQAHDRMRAILEETLDDHLYQALRYIQGSPVGQGAVGASTTLTAALDRAAAGGSADPDAESSLWESVVAERLRYWTATGRPTQERLQLGAEVDVAESDLGALDASIDELEATGEASRRAAVDLAAAETGHAAALDELGEARRAESELLELEAAVDAAGARVETAEARLTEARRDVLERERLVAAVDAAAAEHDALRATHARAGAEVDRTRAEVDRAAAELAVAVEEATRAVADRQMADDDVRYHRAVVAERLLTGRLARLEEARTLEAEAGELLETTVGTAADRDRVEAAWSAVRDAEVALAVGSPTVTLVAPAPLVVEVDGVPVALDDGDHTVAVTGSTVVSVPDVVTVTVTGGASGDDLRGRVEAARRELAGLVDALRLDPDRPVADLDGRLVRRADAAKDLDRARRLRADALDDLTEAELAGKAAAARSTVASHPADRPAGTPLPATPEEAEARLAVTSVRADELERAVTVARTGHAAALAAHADARTTGATAAASLASAVAATDAEEARLAAARAERPDADLSVRVGEAEVRLAEAVAAHDEAARALAARDPATARLRLANATALVERWDADRRRIDQERVRLRTLLERGGADDLQARRDEAAARAADVRRRHQAFEERAAAAALLHDTFLRHRDEARAAYAAPYREQIESLARLVFGPDVRIDVDPGDLSLRSRTLDGRTIPYDSLSTGTKEQLAVLARLACAILVQPDGDDEDAGAPVILDDALGNTDPVRLRALAPAFSEAATRTQIIALASSPDRYGAVGNATVVRLDGLPTPGG